MDGSRSICERARAIGESASITRGERKPWHDQRPAAQESLDGGGPSDVTVEAEAVSTM